jgi:hypothetical protein
MKRKLLKEPFPLDHSPQKALWTSFLFGLFIFLFLLFFQPFGLNNYQSENKLWQILGYGVLTSVVLLLNNFLFSSFFSSWYSEERWTVGKNVLYTSWVLFCIGLGNWAYSGFLHFISLTSASFLWYEGITLLVGIFPITISTLWVYSKRLKAAAEKAKELNKSLVKREQLSEQGLVIPSKNKSESLEVNVSDLLAVKAIENYVEIYTREEGSTQKTVLRNTLKDLDRYFSKYSHIKQCHRSYLVNLDNVAGFSGNAQGLNLTFSGSSTELTVPVSRTYVNGIKEALKG